MRNAFCSTMIKEFKENPYVFLTGDLGFKALEPLQAELGNRFINAGIAEQNMIGVAAGMAKTGSSVWAYSIAPFIYARPFEQIRNDICLHNLPVTLVGNGGGYGYGVMGGTHHAIEDYGAMLCLQNMTVYVPAFAHDLGAIVQTIHANQRPAYLRLGLSEHFDGLAFPAYSAWRKFLSGHKGVLIVIGAISGNILKEFWTVAEHERPAIWVVSELPIVNIPQPLIDEIQAANALYIVEEHVEYGGLGQIMAKKMLEHNIHVKKFHHLFAKGYISGNYGSQNFHRRESGLTKDALVALFKD